jgi:hypothetical protein
MEQYRKNLDGKELPPLTAINLSYNPLEKDASRAFAGTTWQSYTEEFRPSFGTWTSSKDGSYKNTFRLTRTVTKPDPSDPTKKVVLGTEEIPLTDASTSFSPAVVPPKPLPRWTASFFVSRSTKNAAPKYTPGAMLDYRISSRLGVFGGVANEAPSVGLSWRFGK